MLIRTLDDIWIDSSKVQEYFIEYNVKWEDFNVGVRLKNKKEYLISVMFGKKESAEFLIKEISKKLKEKSVYFNPKEFIEKNRLV